MEVDFLVSRPFGIYASAHTWLHMRLRLSTSNVLLETWFYYRMRNVATVCLFCRLISGDLPSHRTYEDDRVVVILPRQPVNPGHVMVVTREHVNSFYDADDDLYTHLMLVVKRMALAIKAAFAPLQVVIETSGIGNRHVHVHVIPVHGLYDRVPQEIVEQQEARPAASDEELAYVAQRLQLTIASQASATDEP